MKPAKQWWMFILGIMLVAGLLWVACSLSQSQNGMRDSDFFSLWAAGRLLGSGISPYNEAEWIQIHQAEGAVWISDLTFLYPLPLAVLFIPFGFLSLQQSSILWLFLSECMIILSIYLCCRMADWDRWRHYFILLLLSAFLFRAVLVTIRNGQLGAFLLLSASLGLYSWSHKKGFLSGLSFGLFILKPPVTGIFFVLLMLWFFYRKSWKVLYGMAVSVGSLIVLSTLIQPGWIRDWLLIGKGKAISTAGTTPTLWGLSATVLPHPTVWFWSSLVLSFIFVGWVFYHHLRAKSEREMLYLAAILLPLSLFITPYLWAYDHILLLIPVVILVAKMDILHIPFLLNSSLLLLLDVVALILLFLASIIGNDRLSAILPLIVIGITYLLFYAESKWRGGRRYSVKSM